MKFNVEITPEVTELYSGISAYGVTEQAMQILMQIFVPRNYAVIVTKSDEE